MHGIVNWLDPQILMIDQFLTPEECESYINYSEYLGYELADVDFYGVRKQSNQIRTNERADIESQELADKLWNELRNYPLPSSELGNPAGLSPYIRFYRYQGKQRFNFHKDGIKKYSNYESQFTVLIYLNSIKQGGETIFRKNEIKVQPQSGRCLLFAHDLWHSGLAVTDEEIKYVMRSDLFYLQHKSFDAESEN